MELSTRGFISPFGRDEGVLSHRVGDCIWICLGGEEKILHSAVVNEATNKKAAEVEACEGRKLGGRARQRLKNDVLQAEIGCTSWRERVCKDGEIAVVGVSIKKKIITM